MAGEVLTKTERDAIKSVLDSWKMLGVEDPCLPLNTASEEGRLVDFFTLDANDKVEVRPMRKDKLQGLRTKISTIDELENFKAS